MPSSTRSAATRRTLLLAGAGIAVAAPGAARAIMARPEEPVDVSFLVGKALRVVKPGQPVTMDYSPDRLTLEVDDGGKILSARFG